jgi:serine/threonine protein phosphatase 1
VGDIHGRLDLLETMLELIARDAQARESARQRTLVFVGDYVDRGPDSRGVVERLIKDPLEGFDTHFLKGNHEAILLDFLEDPWRLDHWLMNGGDATMRSYGVDIERLAGLGAPPEIWRNTFADALPDMHLAFFRDLKLSVSFGDYLFVHAGVRPGVPLAAQSEADLIWIRAPFLDHGAPFGKIVVHGHTPERAPVTRPNRIGIDTGAVFTGRLTALKLQDGSRDFLQT